MQGHIPVPAFDRFANPNLRDKGSTLVPDLTLSDREMDPRADRTRPRAERGTAADDGPHVVDLNWVCDEPSYHIKQQDKRGKTR